MTQKIPGYAFFFSFFFWINQLTSFGWMDVSPFSTGGVGYKLRQQTVST
jgi:hypothetical protein